MAESLTTTTTLSSCKQTAITQHLRHGKARDLDSVLLSSSEKLNLMEKNIVVCICFLHNLSVVSRPPSRHGDRGKGTHIPGLYQRCKLCYTLGRLFITLLLLDINNSILLWILVLLGHVKITIKCAVGN